MAKENPDTRPKTETPFQRFEALARKIVRVPKHQARERKKAQSS